LLAARGRRAVARISQGHRGYSQAPIEPVNHRGLLVGAESRGGDLFIVDNSISGWTGLRYLGEWCGLAERFDIASGFFEIGSLLELDGKWQKLDKIRILMGDEMTRRTKKALLEAVTAKVVASLDASLEVDKGENPFLDGVPAVVEALRSGQIECRVYVSPVG
jgi:hypothetical protein